MKVTIIGLGYVGYPLALQAASKGVDVCGVDKNQSIVDMINKGEHPISEDFINNFEHIGFSAQTKVDSSDVYVICVPTPVNELKIPDLVYVKSAAREIASVLKDEQLVIIESTINPGISEDILLPILETSKVKFGLAHSPERINPGDKKWNVSNIPRVVGGIDKSSLNKALDFYKIILDSEITPVSQIKAAEATKILENSFRDINIAFINEMAQSFYRLGIDTKEVIKGASTKPFAFMPHYPGVGVGGHCIAVDPYYMIEKGKEVGFNHDFLSLARRINSEMPFFTVQIIQDALNEQKKSLNDSTIAVLGVAYKPDVKDDRESPAYAVIDELLKKKAKLNIYDPYLLEKSNCDSLEQAIDGADCILLTTAHSDFLCDLEKYKACKIFIDGRNAVNKEKIRTMGIIYKGIGIN